MKTLILLLLFPTIVWAENTPYYKDVTIKAKMELCEEGQVCFKTSFQRYSEQVFCDGVDVTYSYRNNLSLVGKECIVFTSAIDNHPQLPSEVDKATKDKNTIGDTWDKVKADPVLIKNYAPEKLIDDKVTVYKPYGFYSVDAVTKKPISVEVTPIIEGGDGELK